MSRAMAVVIVLVALGTGASDRATRAPVADDRVCVRSIDPLDPATVAGQVARQQTLRRCRMGKAGRAEVRAVVDGARTLCANGDATACLDLAMWSAGGPLEIVTPDLDAARVFARRSCDLGFDCGIFEDLSYPPPTPAELDDIREAVLRAGIPAYRPWNGTTESPFWCLAFGTDTEPEGVDPPQAFMARFADIEDVRPRSWCVEHRTGNRYSVGPVDTRPRPYTRGRTVRTWTLAQRFDGGGGSASVQVIQKGGTWVAERDDTAAKDPPPFRRADLREDRRRIAAVASAFADAWNRQAFDEMSRLHGRSELTAPIVAEQWRTALTHPAANTRLERRAEGIEVGDSGSMSASARLRLRGTWTPRAGAKAPSDPWKQKGSVTTVRLFLRKQTAWWEPGDWSVSFFELPWEKHTIVY